MMEIKGNGNIVSREFNVSTFIRLHLACKGPIELHQSDEEKVIVETDENLMYLFTVANAGRTLYVSTDAKFKQPVFTSARVKVFIRQLDLLYIAAYGDVFCPNEIALTRPLEIKARTFGNAELNFSAPSIKISNQSFGNFILKGSAEKLEIKHEANGDFDSSQFNASELSIKNAANGNVRLRAEKSLNIIHRGNGYIHYYGNAIVEDVVQHGNGEVKHLKGEPGAEIIKK